MPLRASVLLLGAIASLALPALASAAVEVGRSAPRQGASRPYLQCVPYARQLSGIQIFGDAHTWWDQAAGRYARGREPRVGAVMAFRPSGNMRLGHVAAISRVIDSRTVLLRHANWSMIDGRRGQIEDNVRAIDVSPGNDWSEVRVWYAPIQGMGTTRWPVRGIIYNRDPANQRLTSDKTAIAKVQTDKPAAPASAPRLAVAVPDDPIGEIIARKTGRPRRR